LNVVVYMIDKPDFSDFIEYSIRKKNNVKIPEDLLAKFEPPTEKKSKKNDQTVKNEETV